MVVQAQETVKDQLRKDYLVGDSLAMECGSQPTRCVGVLIPVVLGREDYAWYNDRICFLLEEPVECPKCGLKFIYAIVQLDKDGSISVYGAEPEPI